VVGDPPHVRTGLRRRAACGPAGLAAVSLSWLLKNEGFSARTLDSPERQLEQIEAADSRKDCQTGDPHQRGYAATMVWLFDEGRTPPEPVWKRRCSWLDQMSAASVAELPNVRFRWPERRAIAGLTGGFRDPQRS